MARLQANPILATDSYKLSHFLSYPDYIQGMFSYAEARTGGRDIIVPFGLSMWLQKTLTQQITMADIDEAEQFAEMHGEPFNREGWEHIVENYNGYMPVTIRAVPEGLPVPSGNIIVSVECVEPGMGWLSSYLETSLQRGIWYPTTIASMDRAIKQEIKHYYELTGADMGLLPFALHDFGGRGVTCAEQAEIGGAAHLVNFMGSDTVEGVRAANFYYKEKMAGFSVRATEHSVQCSFSLNDESGQGDIDYLRHQIQRHGQKPGTIISIVIDGYDVYRAAEILCTELRQEIINSKCKVVFRPDSGDMMEVVPRILRLQELAFGSETNALGFRKINNVGIIQGDGVDHMAIKSLLGKIVAMGYRADNVAFGSGGALLQKVNRDTFKFAQKASAVQVDGEWIGIAKNPVTDPGKRSKKGRLTLLRSKLTGEYHTADLANAPFDDEWEDVMTVVYDHGVFAEGPTLAEIRARAAV